MYVVQQRDFEVHSSLKVVTEVDRVVPLLVRVLSTSVGTSCYKFTKCG